MCRILEIDGRGLRCPLPVLKAAKALRALAPGDVLYLAADDPMAAIDLPHFCAENGHGFDGAQESPGGLKAYRLICGPKATDQSLA